MYNVDLTKAKITAETSITNEKIIKDLIKKHLMSEELQRMQKGVNYYKGVHDILYRNFNEYTVDGVKHTNPNRSNFKIKHRYLNLLVDQKSEYIASKPVIFDTKEKNFQDKLREFKDEDFDDTLIDWITRASIKSREWLHFYYTEDGELKYRLVDALGIIPIYDTQYQTELETVIRFYTVYKVGNDGKEVARKKVEWWDSEKVTFYMEDDNGGFYLDFITEKINPRYHWTTGTAFNGNLDPNTLVQHGWGKVPFIPLFNNTEQESDLDKVKDIIDGIDLINSGLLNNVEDFQEIIWLIQGYSGQNASEIAKILKAYGVIKIDDPSGKIDTKTNEIPIEARKYALQTLKDMLYEIGQGVDFSNDKLGNAASGVSLKFMYGPLNSKADKTINKTRKALRQFVWFITDHINRMNNTNYNYKDVNFTFNKSMIVNDKELVETLNLSSSMMSKKDMIAAHPFNSRPADEILADIMKEEADQMDEIIGNGDDE